MCPEATRAFSKWPRSFSLLLPAALLSLLIIAGACNVLRPQARQAPQATRLDPRTVASQLDQLSGTRIWSDVHWLGVQIMKLPTDILILQEIIYETKPDVILECGTYKGGSALYMASICDLMKHGRIITIDISDQPKKPRHPRIKYLIGSSTSPEIEAQVKKLLRPRDTVMVVLDSSHAKEHVRKELGIYSKLVTPGDYLIVEDTHMLGPSEAVKGFLQETNGFVSDHTREKFVLTGNSGGYLRKTR